MIETRYKEKLPNSMSYPIGTNALSHGLRGVQIADLGVSYLASPHVAASKFRQVLEGGRDYPILRAAFTRWDKRPSVGDSTWAQEYLAGVWRLEVFPVLREVRAIARGQLLETGLPAIREWLSSARPPSWYYGRKRCDVIFSSLEGRVRIEEVVEAA